MQARYAAPATTPANVNREPVSDQLERWPKSDEPKTLGSLFQAFGTGSVALLFILLLRVGGR
jgi:hypothetical protein